MMKKILKLVLGIIVFLNLQMNQNVEIITNKYNEFYNALKEDGVKYIVGDDIFIVYDYEYINDLTKEIFSEYDYKLIEYNDLYFELEVTIRSGFYKKNINRKYEIRKGEYK